MEIWFQKKDIKLCCSTSGKKGLLVQAIGRFYKVLQVIQFVFLTDQIQDTRLALVRAYQDLCEVAPLLMLVTEFIKSILKSLVILGM